MRPLWRSAEALDEVLPIDRGEWTSWHHHIEEPDFNARGAAFHRPRTRGGKVNGNAATPEGPKRLNLSGTKMSGCGRFR